MFRKVPMVITLLITLSLVTGFSKQSPIVVEDIEINVMKIAGILRYDIVLKKTKELTLDNNKAGDSPGHYNHGVGLNYSIRPNSALAALMELEQRTKYIKMQIRGSSNSGSFSMGKEEATISLEYAIKKGSGVDEVRKWALDSTLLVLMGNEVIAEVPLSKKE